MRDKSNKSQMVFNTEKSQDCAQLRQLLINLFYQVTFITLHLLHCIISIAIITLYWVLSFEKSQDCAQLRQLFQYYMHNIICLKCYAFYSMHIILCKVFYGQYSMHSILCILFYVQYSMHIILCILLFVQYSMNKFLCIIV